MVKKIKLWADYGAFPLWGVDEIDNIDPVEMPLNLTTIWRLQRWQSAYDATLNQDYPPDSGFATAAAEAAFEREGVALWQQLRQELSGEYEVWYSSDRLGRLLHHPDELPIEINS